MNFLSVKFGLNLLSSSCWAFPWSDSVTVIVLLIWKFKTWPGQKHLSEASDCRTQSVSQSLERNRRTQPSELALPEDTCSSTQEVLLLLVAVRAHSSVDEGQQRLHQIQHQRTAGLSGHEHLNQVQHLSSQTCVGHKFRVDGGSQLPPAVSTKLTGATLTRQAEDEVPWS